MKTIQNLVESFENKRVGNYAMIVTDKFVKLEQYGTCIAYVDRANNQFIAYNSYGSKSTQRAVSSAQRQLLGRGINQIIWGKLQVYPRKAATFVTEDGFEYNLHSAYPLERHMYNPDQLVFATLLWEDGEYKAVYISYPVDHFFPVIENWRNNSNKPIIYL